MELVVGVGDGVRVGVGLDVFVGEGVRVGVALDVAVGDGVGVLVVVGVREGVGVMVGVTVGTLGSKFRMTSGWKTRCGAGFEAGCKRHRPRPCVAAIR